MPDSNQINSAKALTKWQLQPKVDKMETMRELKEPSIKARLKPD